MIGLWYHCWLSAVEKALTATNIATSLWKSSAVVNS